GTSTITAGDRIYVATSRPDVDYLYYRLGAGDWQPYHPGYDAPISSVATLTPFTHSTSVSSNTHEIRLKVVSTLPGTSQIAFGTNAQDAQDYAMGRTPANALINIISQRKYDAVFIQASANEQLLLYVDGYYNYGYGSPVTTAAGEKNMALAAEQKPAGAADGYLISALVISNGIPAAGRDVFFTISTGVGGTLSVSRTATNAAGRAEVRATSSAAGSIDVLARASGVAEQIGVSTRRDIVTVTFGAATAAKNTIVMGIGNANMSVGGVSREIDPGRGTSPMILNDRTLVPIRAIVEAMGGTAGWEEANRQIVLQCNQNNVFMWVDSKEILANGVRKSMDVAPKIINDRTMVPLRGALENLGCEVEWIESTRQIVITYE
ncbi:MAG: stalk domain-containing protein, partial [Clostridiales bacterium]|nr:stalk domain-containing protein [Clostridiales bacterium]